MTVENENRLLDKVELWSSSDIDGSNRKKAKKVLRHDKEEICGIRRKKIKNVVENTHSINWRKRLKLAEGLLNFVAEEMVSTKNKLLFGKMIRTCKKGGGIYIRYFMYFG